MLRREDGGVSLRGVEHLVKIYTTDQCIPYYFTFKMHDIRRWCQFFLKNVLDDVMLSRVFQTEDLFHR
jgi:hypothetical protein